MNSSNSASSSTQADPRLTVSFSSVFARFGHPHRQTSSHHIYAGTPGWETRRGTAQKPLPQFSPGKLSYHKHQKRFWAPVSMTVSWCSFKGVFIAKVLSIAFRIIEQETKKRHIISIDLKRVVAQNTSCSVPMSNAGTNCSKPMGPACIR